MRALLYHVVIWYIFRGYNEQVRVIRFVSLWTFITACLLCFLILGALLWPVVAHCLCATNSLPGSLYARACSPLCSITPTCSDLFPALYSDETNFQVFIVRELESHAPFLAAALRSQWMTGCALRVSDRAADQSLTSDELVFILFLHRVSGNSHLVTQSQWEVQENAFWGFFFSESMQSGWPLLPFLHQLRGVWGASFDHLCKNCSLKWHFMKTNTSTFVLWAVVCRTAAVLAPHHLKVLDSIYHGSRST